MQQVFAYIIKIIVISGMLLLYYYIGLRNNRFHYYNRFYLLLTVIVSLVLPLIHLQWFTFKSQSAGTIKVYNIMYSQGEDFTVYSNARFNCQYLTSTIFTAACILMLLQLMLNVIKIYRLKKLYPVNKSGEFDFIQTDLQSAPFSFFKNIFWRNDIDVNTDNGKQILQHEITHIKQKHSLDKIFMQLVLCLCWMNPFYWLLKKELYLIHEFIADEKAVNDNDAASFAKMLLTAQFGKFEFLPAQSIFYSSIKRRLLMLTTLQKTQFSYLRRIMVLPLIAAVVCLFAFTVKDQNKKYSVQKITAAKPFVLVVDAGHGGKDNGALGDGLYEKNFTLQIAEKIKELSSQYNIDVILTRDNDVFMSPPEKVNFTNAQNADAFISVHVNSSPKNEPSKSGMEVLLSKRNPDVLDNSKVLGSAIIQNLQKDFTIQPSLLQPHTGVWVLDQSKVPSVLIECGYMTDANDITLLKNNEKIELMARNILQGVAMYANNKIDRNNLYQIKSAAVKDTSVPINITLDKKADTANFKTPLYVLDGKIVPQSDVKNGLINPDFISSINVLKDKSATDKYGDAGKNGVIEITSKENKNSSSIIANADTSTKPIFTSAQKEPQFPVV